MGSTIISLLMMTLHLLSISVLLTISSISADTPCPQDPAGWWYAGQHCYLVSQGPLNWFDAQEFCRSQGGHLAEILSSDEEVMLEQVLMYGKNYWLGLTDADQQGTWVVREWGGGTVHELGRHST